MTNFEKIAEMLSVEIREKFKIKGQVSDREYFFTKDGFFVENGGVKSYGKIDLYELLHGSLVIDKFPKEGEIYWHPCFKNGTRISYGIWRGDRVDMSIENCVGIYRTKEEAQEKAKELGWIE